MTEIEKLKASIAERDRETQELLDSCLAGADRLKTQHDLLRADRDRLMRALGLVLSDPKFLTLNHETCVAVRKAVVTP